MDEFDLVAVLTESDDEEFTQEQLSPEDWQDWNSEELLNLWMSIVQYHEEWYLPLRRTFNEFCDFVFVGQEDESLDRGTPLGMNKFMDDDAPEVQAIKDHPFIKGLDWVSFFSLRTK